jgi:hypothetical protein
MDPNKIFFYESGRPSNEVIITSKIAEKVLSNDPLPWDIFRRTKSIRQIISKIIPGIDALKNIYYIGTNPTQL